MGNVLFSTNLQSSAGQIYKAELYSESYIGVSAAIIGGTGSTFYLSDDWTDYLQNSMSVTLYTATINTTATVTSFSYNSGANRTEVILSKSYSASYLTMESNGYIPTFDPAIEELETEWENQGDIIVESIKASSTTITYSNPSDYAYFDRFIERYIESNDNELKLVIYRDNSGWELEWVGNVVIDLVEWANMPKPFPFTIKAIDGLNKLKDIRYNEVTTTPTDVRIKEHIYNLLSKNDLAQFWGANDAYLRESIEYKSNEVSGTLTNAHSPLDYCYISDRMFYNRENNNNTQEGITCYEALRGLLELFNCRIFISRGVYYIQQVRNYDNATSIPYREYTRAMGTYATGSYNHKLTAGSWQREEDLVVLGGGKFAYLPGLYRVSMDVQANVAANVKLPELEIKTGQNTDTYTETFNAYGGVGSGSTTKFAFDVYISNYFKPGDYLYAKLEMYGISGGTTYYLSGGLGSSPQWVTTPYSKLYYDFKIYPKYIGTIQYFSVETPEIPFDGTLTLIFTITMKDTAGTIPTVSGFPFIVHSRILIPLSESANPLLINTDNISTNYTKELKIPSLIITDFSNSTSINVISVAEDYLTTNTKLVKSDTWDAGFDTDDTLTNTRVLEAMSLQIRPLSRYLGGFEGDYNPQFTIVYNYKTYFFNGFSKNYAMDEVNGEWIEQTNYKGGLVVTDWAGTVGEGEIYTGDNTSGLVALLNNNHTVSYIDSAQAAGSVSSLTIGASGLSSSVVKGDKIIIINPVNNEVIEEFTVAADLGSSDTTLSVESKTTTQDIEAGMVFQVKKDTIFQKLNMANKDYMLEVAAGNIAGVIGVNVFGANDLITSGTSEDIWDGGGTYPFPTTAAITQLLMTATQAAMQGGTIRIIGLDANWDLLNQDVDLDGGDPTTPVAITPLRRVISMQVLEDVVTTANVILQNAALNVTYGVIEAGFNQSQMAIYTVPNGYTGYVVKYSGDYAKSTGKDPDGIDFYLWAADRDNGYEFQIKHSNGIQKGGSGFQHNFIPYMKFTQKTDIKVSAKPDASDAHVHGGFDIILVEN